MLSGTGAHSGRILSNEQKINRLPCQPMTFFLLIYYSMIVSRAGVEKGGTD